MSDIVSLFLFPSQAKRRHEYEKEEEEKASPSHPNDWQLEGKDEEKMN